MSRHMEHHAQHGQMSESFLTAAFLSLSGGLQDAYTYMLRGNVFANAQTGNIVLLSQSIIEHDWLGSLHYIMPLIFFALGIAAAEFTRIKYQKIQRLHWRQLILVVEICLLFIVGFLPVTSHWNIIANAVVSFSCAMQVQTFRKVNGYAFASTMCIGNIRNTMESLCAYEKTHDKKPLHKACCYLGIIIMFALGAAVGSFFISRLGVRVIWISCALLFISFMFMFVKEEIEDIEKQA